MAITTRGPRNNAAENRALLENLGGGLGNGDAHSFATLAGAPAPEILSAALQGDAILRAGEAAIVSYETDTTLVAPGSPDGLRFVLLTSIASGTVIYITDRAWTGSAFTNAAGEGTYTYTAPSALAAGTVITLSHAQLATGGITLSNAGETIYMYQGAPDAPTTFLFAADVADGNTTFTGNLTGTGLTNGVNAVAVAQDNGVFTGSPTGIAQTQILAISNTASWYSLDLDDNPGTPTYTDVIDTVVQTPFFDGSDMVIIGAGRGGGQSDVIYRIGEENNAGTAANVSRMFRDNPAFTGLEDISFDLESGFFFFLDTDGNNTNRIMRGNIADLVSGNQTPTFTQIFATDGQNNGMGPVMSGELITGIEIDRVANKIYWWDGDLIGNFEGGWQLYSINYDGTGFAVIATLDTENTQGSIIGSTGGMGDWALDIPHGYAYAVNSAGQVDGDGNGTIRQNHIIRVTLATGAITVLALDVADPRTNTGPGGIYNNGRLNDDEGQILYLDVDQNTGIVYFITHPDSPSGHGSIWSYNPATDDIVELWNQPSPNTRTTLQTYPIANMLQIEVDEIGGRLFITTFSDTNHELDGTPATNHDDASIFVLAIGAPVGTAPTRFVRVFEPTANGTVKGMEIDYDSNVSVTTSNATYTESTNLPNSPAGPVISAWTNTTITDPDQAMIWGATVAITNGFVVGDTLSFTNSGGITGIYTAATGVVVFTGLASLAAYQTVLNSVRFTNAGDNPTDYGYSQSRTLSVTAFDGLTYSDLASVNVSVVGINDRPVNTIPGAAAAVNEDNPFVLTGMSVADPDADPASQDIRVTLQVAHGTITIFTSAAGGVVAGDVTGNGTGTVVITATQNQINATFAHATGVTYLNTLNYNSSDTLTVTTNDLGLNGNDPGISGTANSEESQNTRTINVAAVNDAPTVVGGTTQAVTTIQEDLPADVTGPTSPPQTVSDLFNSHFSDVLDDQSAFPGGSVANTLAGVAVVTNGSTVGTGQWQYHNGTAWVNIGSVSMTSAKLLTLSTPIRFNPDLNYNGAAPSLVAHLVDSSASAFTNASPNVNLTALGTGGITPYSAGTVTLSQTITAVNDAPVNTVPGTLNLSEDAVNIVVGGLSIADVEAGPASQPLTVTLSVARGTLTISTAIAGGINASHVSGGGAAASNATSITVTATQAQINATLAGANGLTYTPISNINGDDTLTIVTSDLGYTGAGGTLTDTDMRTLAVAAVNDAPTIGDGSESVPAIIEDTPNGSADAQTVAALFGPQFGDTVDQVAGGSSAGTMLGIAIVANGSDANGTWQWLNAGVWTAIGAASQAAARTFTAATQIRFNPATDFNGTAPTLTAHLVETPGSITNGGTVNLSAGGATGGATRYSAGTVVLSQSVTAVNDVPVFAALNGTPSFTEGGAAVVLDANATIVDADLAGTNYNGATLTLARSGGASAQDVFGTSGTLTFSAPGSGNVLVGATMVGTFTQSGGTLVITFTSGATQTLVNQTLQQLTYANSSESPPASAVIAYAFSDGNAGAQGPGGAGTASGTVTVSITAVDDPAVAVNDPGNATPENATLNIAVLANDSDPDGTPGVAMINGVAIAVGGTATLPSGAKVKLEANGTLTYDPNGQFNTLTSTASGQTGAVNTSAPDSFTYTLGGTGGGTATVSVTVNGVISAEDHLDGDSGANTVSGTTGGDYFDLSQGGNDTANGLGGNDGFYFGAEFTAADTVDGGAGDNDQIGLRGNYSGGLVLGATTMKNVEVLVVLPGFSYNITTNDANVASGEVLKVQATQLAAGQSLTFNGAAETNGSFLIYGGGGNDNLTGGAGNDGFYFGPGQFNASDIINGGAGTNDQLGLDGSYTLALGSNVTNVEVVVLLPGPSGTPNTFNISVADVFVPATQVRTIFGTQVTTNIVFSGANEHDGAFKIYGGFGNDTFTGSDGADWIFGGNGGDTMTGGLGADLFFYDGVAQSTSATFDKLVGFDDTADTIDLPFAVSGLSTFAAATLSAGSFDTDLATAFAGLGNNAAGVFTADAGDMTGRTFLVVDADGVAGYQAGSDYVIEIVTPASPLDNPGMFV